MDDLFSLDIDFQRICWMTVIGFFILALLSFIFWSIFIYLPFYQRSAEAEKINNSARDFYEQKSLPRGNGN